MHNVSFFYFHDLVWLHFFFFLFLQMLAEMNKIRDELNRKLSEIRHLQMELNRKENVVTNDAAEGLKRVVASLEKENSDLKVKSLEKANIIFKVECSMSLISVYNLFSFTRRRMNSRLLWKLLVNLCPQIQMVYTRLVCLLYLYSILLTIRSLHKIQFLCCRYQKVFLAKKKWSPLCRRWRQNWKKHLRKGTRHYSSWIG